MNEEPLHEIKPENSDLNENSGFLPKETLKRPGLSLLSLFAAGAVMMLIWWGVNQMGWRWPLSVLVVCALYGIDSLLQERKIPAASWVLLGLTMLVGFIPALRSNDYTMMLSIPVTLVSLALLTADLFSGQWWQFRIREYLKAGLQAILAFFVGFPIIASQALRTTGKDPDQKASGKRLALGILKGILITIPLLLIFTFLFAYADTIFESKIDSLFQWIKADFLSQLVGRVFLTLFFTWLLAAALWLLVTHSSKAKKIEPDSPLLAPFLGMTETTITLVSLNLLFAFFLIIQFQYFFAGEANITQDGFTYAQYADRGFRELLLVAAIAGLVYYVLASFTRRESKPRRLIFSLLGGLLLLQVGVVLVSAYQRINMYVNAYGLTAYRFIPQIFILFLAAILLSLVLMESFDKFKRLALILFSAAMLFTLTLAVINVDKVTARHNVERALQGKELDYNFLVNGISTDAEPFLFEVVHSGSLTQNLQQNLEKVLACRATRFEEAMAGRRNWLDYDISFMRAKNLYSQNQDLLQKWPLEKMYQPDGWLGVTIEGDDIYCGPIK